MSPEATAMLEESTTITTLVCGESEFKADRVILSAVSPYFQSAFSSGWKETTAGRVVLPTIHPKSMKIILECINTGQVKHIPRSMDELQQLVKDADYLQFDELVRFIFRLLTSQQLTVGNFRELYDMSQKLNNNQYCVSQVLKFLAENFCDLTKCNDFLFLNANEFMMILEQAELRKHDTKLVFSGILRWTKSEELRVDLLEKFLKILEDHSWCSECLNNCIKENISKAWSSSIMECLRALLAVRTSIVLNSHAVDIKGKLLVFGYTSSNQSVMSTYDKDKNQWTGTQILPLELEDGMAVGAYGSHVFFFGGERSLNDIEFEHGYDQELYYEYDEYDNSVAYEESTGGDNNNYEVEEEYCDYYEPGVCSRCSREQYQSGESDELNDQEQYYECIEYDERLSDTDKSEEYFDYDDYNQHQYDRTYNTFKSCINTVHNILNLIRASSSIPQFLLSFFGGGKVKRQWKGNQNENHRNSNKFLMACVNILNQLAGTQMITFFLSTFEHKTMNNYHNSIQYHPCGAVEEGYNSSQREYYEYEEEEEEELCGDCVPSEQCEILDEVKEYCNSDRNKEKCEFEVNVDEVDDITEEHVSDEDTDDEEGFESSGHDGDSVEEHEDEPRNSDNGDEEYQEEYVDGPRYSDNGDEEYKEDYEYEPRNSENGDEEYQEEYVENDDEEYQEEYVENDDEEYQEEYVENDDEEYQEEYVENDDEEYQEEYVENDDDEYQEEYECEPPNSENDDEEYQEENEEAEYDELSEDNVDDGTTDEEGALDVEYCRVYHNNIDEWNRITIYCPVTNTILNHLEGSLVLSVCLAGAGVLRDCIYVVNGINEHYTKVKHVQRFKVKDFSCDLVAPTNKAHCNPHVLSAEDGMYILGSYSPNDKLVEHYDLLNDQWTVVTHLPRLMDLNFATLCRKKLFLLRKQFGTHFHVYDFRLQSWSVNEYLGGPTKVQWVDSAEVGEKSMLLVYDSGNVMHRYDVHLAQWVAESKQNLNLKSFLFTCTIK